jgi:hypothetical protein
VLLAASVVAVAVALLHSGIGEWLLMRHLPRVQGLPLLLGSDDFAKRTLRWAWHVPSLLGGCLAAILARAHVAGADVFVLRAIAVATLACALLVLLGGRGRHPGWIGFLAVAALSWLGAR